MAKTRLRIRRFYIQRLMNHFYCEQSLYFIFELSLCNHLYLKYKDHHDSGKESIKTRVSTDWTVTSKTVGTEGTMANLFVS